MRKWMVKKRLPRARDLTTAAEAAEKKKNGAAGSSAKGALRTIGGGKILYNFVFFYVASGTRKHNMYTALPPPIGQRANFQAAKPRRGRKSLPVSTLEEWWTRRWR